MIQLPKPRTKIPRKEINPKTLLIYGSPKVGKTSIIESLQEDYLLIEIDPNGAAYFEGTYIECNSLEQLNEIGNEIISQDRPYKYIIIDTITKLAEWMESYATEMYRASSIGKSFKGDNVVTDLARGAGYLWLRRAYVIWFEFVKTLADRIIFIGHVKDAALTTTSIDSLGNQIVVEKLGIDEVSSMDIDLVGKLKQITCSQLDAIGFLYRKTIGYDKDSKQNISQLRINFNAGTSILGGARPQHLRGQDFEFSWDKIYLK